MKQVFIFWVIVNSSLFFSQTYRPIDTADYPARKEFMMKNELRSQTYINTLKSKFSGSSGKEIVNNYKEYQKEFISKVKNRDFTFQPEINQYLNSILSNLQQTNQAIPNNITILVAKENIPNAMCIGDGTFVINMGLFNWLDNEDQLAAILGHEVAHKMKEHTLHWQQKLLDIEHENNTKVKQLKSQKTNVQTKAFDLLKNSLYKGSVERRRHEQEADSLGYVLFKKTNYQKQAFVNALKNLETYDTISPTVVEVETYKKFFDLADAPFKEKWMKMEDFSQYQYDFFKEKLDKDSMASHPEIVQRVALLQKSFPELKSTSGQVQPQSSKMFEKMKSLARMETVPNLYHSKDYGMGIYASLQYLQKGEEELYYKKWLGKLFDKIKDARKNYNLNRYLDRVDPKNQSKSYQQFLNFMWNLSLEDIEKIAVFYNKNGS